MLLLLLALSLAQACTPPNPALGLYVQSGANPASADGSDCLPYASISAAVAALTPGGGKVVVVRGTETWSLGGLSVQADVTLDGKGGLFTLDFPSEVGENAAFTLVNVTLGTAVGATCTIKGSLSIRQSTLQSIRSNFTQVYGSLEILESRLTSSSATFATLQTFGGSIHFLNSDFSDFHLAVDFQPTALSLSPASPASILIRNSRLSNFDTAVSIGIDRTIFSGTYEEVSTLTLDNATLSGFRGAAIEGNLYFWTVLVTGSNFRQGYIALRLGLNDRDHLIQSSNFTSLALAANITNLVSAVNFQSCFFSLNGQSLMLSQGAAASWFAATMCTFNNIGNSTSVGAAVFAQNAGKVSLINSKVTNSRALKGAAVTAYSSVLVEIVGCYMSNLVAIEGAVMDIEYSNVNVRQTEVDTAKADGAVFYVYEQSTNYDSLTVRNAFGTGFFFFAFESATIIKNIYVESCGTEGQFMILAVSTIPCYVSHSVFTNVTFGIAFVLPYAAQVYHFDNITVSAARETSSNTLFSNFGTLVNITRSTFSGTMQTVVGGVGPAGNTLMAGCVFKDLNVITMFAPGSAVLQIYNSIIRDSVITDSKASPLSTTPMLLSNVSVSGITGQFLSSTQSTLTFVLFSAANCTVPTDFNFIDAVQSQMSFTNASFHSFTMSSSSSLIAANLQSSVSVLNSSFKDIKLNGSGGIVIIDQSAGVFDLIQAKGLTSTFIASTESSLSISNSSFTDVGQVPNPRFNGGVLNGLQMLSVNISNCNFTQVGSRSGGVCYITYTNPNKASIRRQMATGGYVYITNCRFVNCRSSGDGAAVYMAFATATIADTIFSGNRAGWSGGALALYCDPAELQFTCVYYINRTDFSNNTAGAGGGAIKYDKIKPVYTNITYSNNTALYGDVLAAFPVELRYFYNSKAIPPPILDGESGTAFPEPIQVALYDELNQLVVSSTSEIEGIHGSLATSNKTTLISGLQTVQVEDGICSFAGLSVTDAPGSLVNLELTSDAIDYQNANPNTNILSKHLDINLLLRSCYIGEIIKNSVCDICVSGTYSFNTNDTVCKSCPGGMTCHGGANTTVSRDHWRPLNTSELLLECYAKDICLGGNLAKCDTGYGGRLCTFCDPGYFRFGNFFCLACGNTVWGIFRGILVLMGTAVFLIVMILGNLRNTAKRKSHLSIHFRIFLNYNQVTMLMSSFQIKWPVDLISFFEGLKLAGNASQFAFSNECITGDSSINYIYQKVLLVALIPLILIVFAVIIWGIVGLIRQRSEYLRIHVMCSIIVLLLSMQPIVLQSSLQMYPCVEVENGSLWLLHDMHIPCWEGGHNVYAFAVALPAILIWCIGTPLLFWAVLFRQRKNLNEAVNVRRIGFLYSGYHPQFYYWEFVVVLRKSLMVIIANLMVTTQSKVQSQVAITVLWFFVILQYKEMPFDTRRFNRTEFLSLFASLITVISGALYLSDLRTQPGAYYTLLIIVFFSNSLFMFLWIVLFAVYLASGRSKKIANMGTWLDKVTDKYWRV